MPDAPPADPAPEVHFYHMTTTPLEVTLPVLLEKSLAAGWRVAVRGVQAARIEWLDGKLWLAGGDLSFLPHGIAGGPHDAAQPVLLQTCPPDQPPNRPPANGARALVSIDGAPVGPDEPAAYARVMILFDGADPAALDHARDQWRALRGAARLIYWSQETGRWEKKAEA